MGRARPRAPSRRCWGDGSSARDAATSLVIAAPKGEMATVLREGAIAGPHARVRDAVVGGPRAVDPESLRSEGSTLWSGSLGRLVLVTPEQSPQGEGRVLAIGFEEVAVDV